ncbi:radical SAM protein [Methylobacterium oryzisoli]|uniref:radical SAM protein n=1 Tax=Methylobacterium oryzisoli TaxID=3385502 RepID=UPI00389213E9
MRPAPCAETLLVFGGPYSNLEATQAVLEEAAALGIPPERVVCTGDVVAYGADAAACLALVREAGIRVVAGNCEVALAESHGSCGCGFAPGSACDRLSAAWFAHAAREIGAADRAWMAALPRRLDLTVGGLRLAVVHAVPDALDRFVFASTPARVKARYLADLDADGIVVGHSGLPFSQVIEGRLWHNAGAVGLPANDGTASVWYSLLAPGPEPRSLTIRHDRLDYPAARAARKMRAAGLPEGYAACLETGLWPSCDALPPAEAKRAGQPLAAGEILWRRDEPEPASRAAPCWPDLPGPPARDPGKFRDPAVTAAGEPRAVVALSALRTLWINTGTRCNLACATCYIESTPYNDRLAFIAAGEVAAYLDEIEAGRLPVGLVGFTGGEPFLNRDLPAMLDDVLGRGLPALVLTNAMRPMRRHEAALRRLQARHPGRLGLRVSLDHYSAALHEVERGAGTFAPALDGLVWLARAGFSVSVAGRLLSGEAEGVVRAGYGRLFAAHDLPVDPHDPEALVLFPDMEPTRDVPEITQACWGLLGRSPESVMCASARMVVKRQGAARPAVLACTLLAYDPQFELGATLAEAARPVALNHPFCAQFCVLGGAACSRS